MKTTKRIISLCLVFVMMLTVLSGLTVTFGAIETASSKNTNSYMMLHTPNGNGYNMELAASGGSTSPYILEANTKYRIDFTYKNATGDDSGCIAGYVGSKSAYDGKFDKYNFSTIRIAADTEWHNAWFSLTTPSSLESGNYSSSCKNNNICDRLYLVANGGTCTIYIDNVIITKYASNGTTAADIVTLDFETENCGYSAYNGTWGTNIDRITEVIPQTNSYMMLHTPNSNGYNMELASGPDSSTPYTLIANTKYKITYSYKNATGDAAGCIAGYVGSQSAWSGSLDKVSMSTMNIATDTEWHDVWFSFTTPSSLESGNYNANCKNNNICDKLYLVVNGNTSTVFIDNVTITRYAADGVTVADTVVLDFETFGKGYSAYSGTWGTHIDRITETVIPTNSYLMLHTPNGNGYNFELASANDSSSPYVLEPNTKYRVSYKYKNATGDNGGCIAGYVGSQSTWNASLDKVNISTINIAADTEWHDSWFSFTTPSSLESGNYNSSCKNNNVCDNLYLVANGVTCTVYIDDVAITKYASDGIAVASTVTLDFETKGCGYSAYSGTWGTHNDWLTEQPEADDGNYVSYTISDFKHSPYNTLTKGTATNKGYASYRFYTDTVDSNSVIGYSYYYNIDQNVSGSAADTGVRGDFVGHNFAVVDTVSLFHEADKAVVLSQNKAYRVSFKYKVLDVESGSYVALHIARGLNSATQTGSYGASSQTAPNHEKYLLVKAYAPTDGWLEVSYTFLASFVTSKTYNVLQIGGTGFGNMLIDDIKIEGISPDEVVERVDEAADYKVTSSGDKLTLDSYLGSDEALTVKPAYNFIPTEEIGDYAFLYNRFVKDITIENGPTTIGRYAFEYARKLETVRIPASITTIGKGAFYGIKNMKSFTVDAANENFVSVDSVLYTKDMKTLLYYPAAKDATTFTVPATVTTIAEGAFLNATKLQTVVLPLGLTTIERRAFMNCTALENADLPSTVATIGSSAFRGCDKLNRSQLSETVAVGENAFADCDTVYTVGNVNSADGVDALDNAVLTRHIAGWPGYDLDYFEKLSADINGDGTVDALDNAILTRHIADWPGYKTIPYTGYEDHTYEEYTSDSETPELVVNLSKKYSQKVTSDRDIEYDPNKEDVIIVLVVGQSNSTDGVGYKYEYSYKYKESYPTSAPSTHPDYVISAEPTRPLEGTVFSGSCVTALTSANDVYNLADASRGTSTMGGYTPAFGKAIHEATGAKIVFVQAAVGAVGMHEWTPNPETYDCACSNGGKNMLYHNAVTNYLKTYQALDEDYNIVATAYVYNQGEHEEYAPYKTEASTIHSAESYAKALKEMHEGFMADCSFDMGGIFLPRSFFARYNTNDDTVENSRRHTYARAAMYSLANSTNDLFIFSNAAEQMSRDGIFKPDPTNDIHYSQIVYNAVGDQCAASMLSYLGIGSAPEFTGITVYNEYGIELARFDTDGNLISGNRVVDTTVSGNAKLQIAIQPVGTYYTFDVSDTEFIDDYGIVTLPSDETSFTIVINPPVK